MIVKQVNIWVEAQGRTATEAQIKEIADGAVIFDLFDAIGLVALNRYALLIDAPFVLAQAEIDALTQV